MPASARRQVRQVQEKLPHGWFIAAHFWDVESGGLDLDQRGHGTLHEKIDARIPRDGGMAALLAEAGSPSPRFAAVMCEDIERSARDTFSALKLEKKLSAVGIPLLATDEPIDIAGMNATTILVRRIKQGIAEWYRLQVKEKAWNGFREHAIDGYNIGAPPYGYLAHRIPHPAPGKAAQGRTKTRLALDPGTRPHRGADLHLADRGPPGHPVHRRPAERRPAVLPAARGQRMGDHDRSPDLGQPQVHRVHGLRPAPHPGRQGRPVPPDQWLWSPEPAHPAIISRDRWDAAQAAGAEHSSSRDPGEPSTHPATRRAYPLRSIIRCRECRRRISGSRKYSRPGATGYTYYRCPHDASNPRHAATAPDHPPTIQVREDLMLAHIAQFLDTRIFGPDRAALLTAVLPTEAAGAARRRDTETAALHQRIRQIDAAENSHAREIEALAHEDPNSPAVTALRSRILARFAELEEERAAITPRLTQLTAAAPAASDPGLLDQLPHLAGLLQGAPARLQQQLCHALGLQLLYNAEDNQVTCFATIIADSELPHPPPPANPTAPNWPNWPIQNTHLFRRRWPVAYVRERPQYCPHRVDHAQAA